MSETKTDERNNELINKKQWTITTAKQLDEREQTDGWKQ